MSKQKIFIIVGLIILVSISVILRLNLKQKLQPTPTQPSTPAISQPTQEPQQKPEPIDTSNWKIYRNEKYGFEVRYPNYFDIRTIKSYPQTVVIFHKSYPDVQLVVDPINVGRESVFDIGAGVSLNDGEFAGKKAKIYNCPEQNECPQQISYSKAIHLIELPLNWESGNEINLNVPKGKENLIETVNQILSTFRFIK
jgi:hypothetical protein